MILSQIRAVALAFVFTFTFTFSTNAVAQVLEATLYGVVQDTSRAVCPG